MDDLSGKISSFLDDPNNAETIKSITGLLGGSMGAGSGAEAANSGNGSSASGLDPEMMAKLKRIIEKTSTKNDNRVNLLLALKPYLNEKRKGSMESALKMMRLAKLASIIGDGFEL